MKKIAALVLALILLVSCIPAMADGYYYGDYSNKLISFKHNCTNTGIMLPKEFDPNVTTYILTVASWVSRPYFTLTAYDKDAVITVNGQVVRSGANTQIFNMTDEPQKVEIVVTSITGSTTYTVFLQRRPSERRTRVSAGYINNITTKNSKWYIDADLVTLKYNADDYSAGAKATFTNTSKEVNKYNYVVNPHCEFYYGSQYYPTRASSVQDFLLHYTMTPNVLYKFVYIEDEIVAVFPYSAEY